METIDVISVEDPALDRDKMDVRKYGATRDAALLVLLPGAVPVRWTLRDLTMAESDMCDDRPTFTAKLNFALSFCLVKVDDGREGYAPTAVVPDAERGGNKTIWTNEGLAKLRARFGKGVIREIATIVCQRDERSGEAFGGGVPSFTLPPLSLDALARIERQRAA